MSSDNPGDKLGTFKPSEVKDPDIYRFLYTYYLHQDKLSWSRTQTLVAIEAGVLAGAFAAKEAVLAVAVLTGGSVLVYLTWRLVLRDWEVRDQFMDHFDAVHGPANIRFTPQSLRGTGKCIIRAIVYALITVNIFLAGWFGCRAWTFMY